MGVFAAWVYNRRVEEKLNGVTRQREGKANLTLPQPRRARPWGFGATRFPCVFDTAHALLNVWHSSGGCFTFCKPGMDISRGGGGVPLDDEVRITKFGWTRHGSCQRHNSSSHRAPDGKACNSEHCAMILHRGCDTEPYCCLALTHCAKISASSDASLSELEPELQLVESLPPEDPDEESVEASTTGVLSATPPNDYRHMSGV